MKLSDLTPEQIDDYVAGRLRLTTKHSTGESRLIPAKPRANDRGITDSNRRAYIREWYLKNRDKRRVYSAQWRAKKLALAQAQPQPLGMATPQEKKNAYQRAYRAKLYAKGLTGRGTPRVNHTYGAKWTNPNPAIVRRASPGAQSTEERLAKKRAYQTEWRRKNKARLPHMRKMWHAKYKHERKAKVQARVLPVQESAKPGFIRRILGSLFSV